MKEFKVEVLRQESVESSHQVHLLAVDQSGKTLIKAGDIKRATFPRSAIKPIQAMLFAEVREPKTSEDLKRLSLASSSHWAEKIHLDVVRDWHHERGFKEDDLICGPQIPRDPVEQRRLILEDQPVCRLHNNCSGKHTGFLQVCQERGWPLKNYGDFNHPLQQLLRRLFSDISGVDWDLLPWGIDGCGIPTSLVPLEALVKMSASFVRQKKSDVRIARVIQAVQFAPEMVSSTTGFCSKLILESQGEWLVKTGAEGNYFGVNLLSGSSFFLKAEDGNTRASEFATLWLCEQLGQNPDFQRRLEDWKSEALINWAGEKIGRLRLAGA